MVVVSYSGKEINAKLVYYGPGLSGKTTNLEYIYQSVPSTNRGKMVSMKTRTERTLFFDFLPIDLGDIGGFKTRFLLYTVPGQVYYNATRKLVLRGVDSIIFVADSGRGKMDENIESLQNLKDNLKEYGLNIDEIPWIIQYNKRDLPDVYSIEELEEALNPTGVPYFEASSINGTGVFEAFRGISKLLLQKLGTEIKLGSSKDGKASGARTGRPTLKPVAPAAPAAPAVAPPVAPPVTGGTTVPYQPTAPATPAAEAPVEPVAPVSPVASELEAALETTPAPTPYVPTAQEPQTMNTAPPSMEAPPPELPGPLPAVMPDPEPVLSDPVDILPETPEVELAPPATVPGTQEWTDEHAAAEEAALEEEIKKRASQKADDDDFMETPKEKKRGFWGKIFKKKNKYEELESYDLDSDQDYEMDAPEVDEPTFEPVAETPPEIPEPTPAEPEPEQVWEPVSVPTPAPSETRLAEVEVPGIDGSGDGSPVVITREIEVPVSLSSEEIRRGVKLRLSLEIKIQSGEGTADGETRVA